jgi:hypothetical protein
VGKAFFCGSCAIKLAREAPMNRYKDYICFVIWFAGLSTIVLWLLTSPYAGGRLFGDALFCRADAFVPLGWLCLSAHPLPFALQAFGAMCALIMIAQVLMRALRRSRLPAATPMPGSAPGAADPQQRWQAPSRFTNVKPRTHFGLRGGPR